MERFFPLTISSRQLGNISGNTERINGVIGVYEAEMEKKCTKFKAEILKKRIKEAGLTAKGLSKALGKSDNYVSNAIGKGSIPSEEWEKLNVLIDAKSEVKEPDDGKISEKDQINKKFAAMPEKPANPKKNERAIINLEQTVRKMLVEVDRLTYEVMSLKADQEQMPGILSEMQLMITKLTKRIQILEDEKKKGFFGRFRNNAEDKI